MNEKIIEGVLGKGKSNSMFKDNDGDKIMNVYDCEPNNRLKQGFFDDAKRAAMGLREKVQKFRDEKEERRTQERAIQKRAKEKAEVAYFEERTKVAEEKAIKEVRERARGTSKSGLQRFTEGIGNVTAGLSGTTQPTKRPMPMRTRSKIVKKTRFVKQKDGTFKKQNVFVKQKVQMKPLKQIKKQQVNGLNSFLVGSSTQSGGLNSLLGTGGKKKNGGLRL